MGLLDNIYESLGLQDFVNERQSKITVIGKNAVYIECAKSIKSYEKTEIIVRLKDGELIIRGEELYIKKYCEGDIAICGKLKIIERV